MNQKKVSKIIETSAKRSKTKSPAPAAKAKIAGNKANKGSRPMKMKDYASFADWNADQSPRNKKLIAALAKLVEQTAPRFQKVVKWGQGCWTLNGVPKIYIHAEEDHLHFGFYNGALMHDPQKLLKGSGKFVRHVKVFTASDIATQDLTPLIKQTF